jgi:hypothetical protein
MIGQVVGKEFRCGGDGTLDQLSMRIRRQLVGRIRDFRLLHDGDGLVLRGFAPTFYAKQIAQHAVMEATSLPISANEIWVPDRARSEPAPPD